MAGCYNSHQPIDRGELGDDNEFPDDRCLAAVTVKLPDGCLIRQCKNKKMDHPKYCYMHSRMMNVRDYEEDTKAEDTVLINKMINNEGTKDSIDLLVDLVEYYKKTLVASIIERVRTFMIGRLRELRDNQVVSIDQMEDEVDNIEKLMRDYEHEIKDLGDDLERTKASIESKTEELKEMELGSNEDIKNLQGEIHNLELQLREQERSII
jgi:predicted RNase H-like nuclease (RuvC/YqgF family)